MSVQRQSPRSVEWAVPQKRGKNHPMTRSIQASRASSDIFIATIEALDIIKYSRVQTSHRLSLVVDHKAATSARSDDSQLASLATKADAAMNRPQSFRT